MGIKQSHATKAMIKNYLWTTAQILKVQADQQTTPKS